MTTRLIVNDTDELNVILERAFANISNPLEAKSSAWTVLEQAIAEAYSLGATTAALVGAGESPAGFFKAA